MRTVFGRRAGTIMAATLIAGALAVVGATPGQAAEVPAAPLAFGAYAKPRNGQSERQAVEAYEAQAGRKLAVVRVFETWDQAFPDSYHTWLKDSGHSLILSVKPTRSNGTRITWTSIATAPAGSQVDTEMRSWARRVKAYGAPIYVTFHHEPESGTGTAGTNVEFIAAWRRWVDVFREEGVTNAKFMWIMTDYSFFVATSDRRYAPKWYPGDGWVDAMGTDAYNWYTCRPGTPNSWKSLQQIIDPFRAFGAQHPDKSLWLSEYATVEDPAVAGRKTSWLDSARALFKQPGWDQFDGIVYFNATYVQGGQTVCLWYTDTSAPALASYKAGALDPFYNGPAFQDAPPDPDVAPPSAPGQPTATSTISGRATVTWPAATDDRAASLTYSIYRDGGTQAVGTVAGPVTGTVSFDDAGLAPGSVHTWVITASDGTNTGQPSAASDPVTIAGDAVAPSAPGTPSGTSTVAGRVTLTWPAATDDLATSLTYRIYRDGGTTAVGTVVGGVTGTVSFDDTGLAPGSVHTWTVTASDGTNTGPPSAVSDPVTVASGGTGPTVLIETDFTNGLSGWTGVSNLTIDTALGSPTDEAPSLRVQANNQVATGRLALPATATSVCADFDFRPTSISSAAKYAPVKLRAANGASVGRIWISNTGSLRVRADITGAEYATTSVVALGTWHRLGLCATVGAAGSLSLKVDGVTVGTWTANTGTSPVATVQLGDNDARTATANWDALVVTVP